MFNCPSPTIDQEIVASAARTADGAGTGVAGFGAAKILEVTLDVTAVAGEPGSHFEVIVEESPNGSTWTPRASFRPTGPGKQAVTLMAPVAAQLRARWVVVDPEARAELADTSITFTVSAKGL